MTATVRIVSDRRDSAMRVPNAALRYRPPGVAAQVDEQSAAGPGPQRRGPAAAEAFVKRLVTELSLTADQQRELSTIMEDSRRDFAALRDQGLPPDQMRGRGQALRARTGERIAAILTPEQRPRYAELRAAQSPAAAASLGGRVWVLGADGQPRPGRRAGRRRRRHGHRDRLGRPQARPGGDRRRRRQAGGSVGSGSGPAPRLLTWRR